MMVLIIYLLQVEWTTLKHERLGNRGVTLYTRKGIIFYAEGYGLPHLDPAEVQSSHWDTSLDEHNPQNYKKAKLKWKWEL